MTRRMLLAAAELAQEPGETAERIAELANALRKEQELRPRAGVSA